MRAFSADDAAIRRAFRKRIRGELSERDEILVMFAYRLSVLGHADQRRDAGGPFAIHPRRVALILAQELGIGDPEMLIASLLHDLIENANPKATWVMTWKSMRVVFGERVHNLVQTLTQECDEPAEQYFTRIVAAGADAQAIKLADRLDNVRELSPWPPARQRDYIEETREFILPIADRINARLAREIRRICKDTERRLARTSNDTALPSPSCRK